MRLRAPLLSMLSTLLFLCACGPEEELPRCGQPVACEGESCLGSAWTSGGGVFGDACEDALDCQSGLCAEDPEEGLRYCTEHCLPGAGSCPGGATCYPAGDDSHVCGPPTVEQHSGCVP